MKFLPTDLPNVIVIEPQIFGDSRGFFMETYQSQQFEANGIQSVFVQDNHSGSRQGILRGLHYQIQQPQAKLIRAVSGKIFDVAVDLRRGSPTFGKWTGIELSAENKLQVWIPQGFAHGFYVMSEWAEVIYKTDNYYAPQWERTLIWNDPQVGIEWPLLEEQQPALSTKDSLGLPLSKIDLFD